MLEEKNEFDVEIVKTSDYKIAIKDYDDILKKAKTICDSFNTTIIQSDADNKLAKEFRAKCNKAKDQIKNLRISTVEEITGELVEQAKSLEALFDAKQKEVGAEIKAYDSAKKEQKTLVNKTKTYSLKLTYTLEKLTQKIIDFCEKNNITVEEI